MNAPAAEIPDLARALSSGERGALARAITLVESVRPQDQAPARALIESVLGSAGGAVRIGITGAPGAGKSTLIDQLGVNLTAAGHRVAVLAIDPSSARGGGSILADKTRMHRLVASPDAFVRPSPSSGIAGGGGRRTSEAIILCEAAGFDVVIVETVGTGQSEAAVADMVDFFIVLIQPGAGDELQGLKKGVLEVADLVAITKCDDPNSGGRQTAGAYRAALDLLAPSDPNWKTRVIEVSALNNIGMDEMWSQVMDHRARMEEKGELAQLRREQDARRLRRLVEDLIVARHFDDPGFSARVASLEERVRAGDLTPAIAAEEALAGRGVAGNGETT